MCLHFGLFWIVSFGLVWIMRADFQQWGAFCLCIIKFSGNSVYCSWGSDFHLTSMYISVSDLQKKITLDKKDPEPELPNNSLSYHSVVVSMYIVYSEVFWHPKLPNIFVFTSSTVHLA